MSEQQKTNMIVFLVLNLVIGYVAWSQLLSKQMTQEEGIRHEIGQFEERVTAGQNLNLRTAAIESRVQECEPLVKKLLENFPTDDQQKSEISLELNALPEQVAGLEIRRSPPLTERTLTYTSPTLQPETIEATYRQVILESMTPRPLGGREIIPNALEIQVYEQEMEIGADYGSLFEFLIAIGKLPHYYEIVEIQFWQDPDARSAERMEAKLRVVTFNLKKFHEVST